jgi:FtsZ-interacting cell division protein ZipA
MSTIAIIAIVIGGLIVLGLLVSAIRSRARRKAYGREQLRAHRDDIRHHEQKADERRIEAAVAGERAKRAETAAELDEERAARRKAELQQQQ